MFDNMNFEQALRRLEDIVGKLEDGELSLEESLEVYQEGVLLSRLCSKKLEEAEGKVFSITNKNTKQIEEFNVNRDI